MQKLLTKTVALLAIVTLFVPVSVLSTAYAAEKGWNVTVTDAETGDPIAGVTVEAENEEGWSESGTTDSSGYYLFVNPPGGIISTVVADPPDGYVSCSPDPYRINGDGGRPYSDLGNISFGFKCVPEEPVDKEIEAKALLDHSCDIDEWHFAITGIEGDAEAPESIEVMWENGDSQTVTLDGVTGKTAHYYSYDNLDSTVESATAMIDESWGGQFNLSHGPDTCDKPDNPPTIVLDGDDPLVMCAGDAYIEPGFLAEDEEDGDLTSVVVVGGDTVDENTPPGTYTIVYEVTDSDYNTVSVERTVKVKDCSPEPDNPPEIEIVGNDTVKICSLDQFNDPGAIASDPEDGNLTDEVVVTGSVDTSTPGVYTLVYTVTDSDGNTATTSRKVVVEDCSVPDNPPTIELIGADKNQLCVNLTYEDKGATASDPEDGDLDHAIEVTGSVDTSTPGEYTLVYSVTDSDGNTASVSRLVKVRVCGGGGGGGSDDPDGSIRICKMVHNGETFVDGSEHAGEFTIEGYDFDFPDSRDLESTTFNTPLDLNTDLFGDDGVDDAECIVYDDLKLGSYGYDQEAIVGEGWLTPLYTDEHSIDFDYPASVFEYDDALQTPDQGDDASRNKNADGDIRLTEDRPDRTLVVVNRYEKPQEEESVYVQPYKYECPLESMLPNWGDGASDLTIERIEKWADENPECKRVEWEFEWAPKGTANPGDNIIGNAGGNWNSFTNLTAIAYDDVKDLGNLWVREVFQEGYVPFSGVNKTQDVSAELYAHKDVLNYDNYDRIDGPFEPGETYLVVGFNALVEEPEENIPPVAEIIGDTSFCIDDEIALVASSTDPDGEIVSYLWDWGDGATSTGATSSHMYAATGTYAVSLTVTDDDGATTTATTTVIARTCSAPPEDPTIEILGSKTIGVCETLTLTASSSAEVSSYEWNFGDGSTTTGQTASHQYDATGTYTVTLTAFYGDGLSTSTSATVTVTNCDNPGGGGGSSSRGGGSSGTRIELLDEPEPASVCTEADRPSRPLWIWTAGVLGDNIVHLKHLFNEQASHYLLFEYHNDTPNVLVRTHILDVENSEYRVVDLDNPDTAKRIESRSVSLQYGTHGWTNLWLNVGGLTDPYTDFHIYAYNAECGLLSERYIIYDDN